MRCCKKKPVIKLSGGEELCKSHFVRYFEKKVRKTIRIHSLLGKKEDLGIIVSDINSIILLDLLKKITKANKKIKIISLNEKNLNNILKKARKLKLTKIAIGHNLDYEAQSIILKQIEKNYNISIGPVISIKKNLKIIKPLYFCSDKEVKLYAKLNKIKGKSVKPKGSRAKVAEMLDKLELKFPGTKNSVVKSFLEVLPLLGN